MTKHLRYGLAACVISLCGAVYAQGVTVTSPPCPSGASNVGGLCVAPVVPPIVVPPPPPPPPPPPSGWTLGQVPFTATSAWNTPISATASYTQVNWPATTGYNYSIAWDSYSPAVYVAQATDPMVAVPIPDTWGWPAQTLHIRMPAAANGAQGTDGEVVVISPDASGNLIAHNFWQFKRTSSTTATASSYGAANVLTDTGFGYTPFKSAGISAIGASELGGLIIKAETDAGPIKHAIALRLDAPFAQSGFVAPAIAGDGGASCCVKEGARLAIPKNVAMPSGLSVIGQKVFIAAQTYGMIANDKAGGVYGPRAQANAYTDAEMTALWHDMDKIVPKLQAVH